ncbi:hypothetical protein BY996DRAFT_8686110 [Phakopsora pachyrhizi]|nr:hypothetical protein BY996DRAFT_8686110 [Phakopsora pachyrhizi]
MEPSSQDAIFDGEIEFITKEAFLINITVVISGQPLPLDYNIKIENAALLCKRKRPKNKKVIKNKKTFTAAPETSSGLKSNIITVYNPGIANFTQTVSNDQQANIAESKANPMHNPDTQEPQSMTRVQIPSQVETSIFLKCSNISHQPTNSNASGDPNNIYSTLMAGPPDSNCTPINSDLAINPAVTNSANTLIPKVPLPVPVSCPSRFFFQHEDVLSATLGSIYHNRGAILPMEGCKANDNTIKDPASGTFKNLDDFVDKIVHVLIAINMVQEHAKCQDNPAGPSSSIHPKRKGVPQERYWDMGLSAQNRLIKLLTGTGVRMKKQRTLIVLLDQEVHVSIESKINFGDTWHSKVNDSRKQHLSLPKKALVNAVISELS